MDRKRAARRVDPKNLQVAQMDWMRGILDGFIGADERICDGQGDERVKFNFHAAKIQRFFQDEFLLNLQPNLSLHSMVEGQSETVLNQNSAELQHSSKIVELV